MIVYLLVTCTAATYAIWKLIIRPKHFTKLPNIPGPPPDSWLFGSQLKAVADVCSIWHLRWFKQYGNVFRYRITFGEEALAVIDPKAIQHILLHQARNFPKPADEVRTVGLTTGKGLMVVEGEDHRRQRKILTPAFSQAQIESYFYIFTEQAKKLVGCLDCVIEEYAHDTPTEDRTKPNNQAKCATVNISDWLTRTTLDIIGQAGFGYRIGALDNQEHPLVNAFARLLNPIKMTPIVFLGIQAIARFPWISKIPVPVPFVVLAQRSLYLMKQCARDMLDSKMADLKAGQLDDKKDILSCIIKANKLAVLEKDKLTDEELVSTVATYLLLGHETSAGALSWILHELSMHQDVQERLRAEIKVAQKIATLEGRADLTYDEVDNLEYLDAVIREDLRYHPSLPMTLRRASTDQILPLQHPITGLNGKIMTEVHIAAGQLVMIDIKAFNRQTDIFGDDAEVFRPDRWIGKGGLLESGSKSYLAYHPLLSFIGGPRGCIAVRFAIIEMKAILLQLIKSFEFQPTGETIEARWHVSARPTVKDRMNEGAQLPINIKRLPVPVETI